MATPPATSATSATSAAPAAPAHDSPSWPPPTERRGCIASPTGWVNGRLHFTAQVLRVEGDAVADPGPHDTLPPPGVLADVVVMSPTLQVQEMFVGGRPAALTP